MHRAFETIGRTAILAAMTVSAAGATAQAKAPAHAAHPVAAAAPAPQGPPRLLVAIAVDQYSADLFAQYRQHYTGGLARLLGGAVFPSAFQSHAATETCPGHSTLLTGVHPSRSGIIGNSWYDMSLNRPDKRVYCAEDEHDANSTASDPVVSPGHLRVPTLGERMKQRWPGSRNVAVSAKDRAVMMMGGHNIDEVDWWVNRGFSTLPGRSLSESALEENEKTIALIDKGAPGLPVPAWCAARARPVTVRQNAANGVPAQDFTEGNGTFVVNPGQGDDVRISPRVDAATLDLAAKLVAAMKLGKGAAPDMLSISLSATDYIGHAYGTEGQEMCIQQAQLDAALGAFFARLDAMGIDYAVVLTADHGGLDTPERLDQQALPAALRADRALTAQGLSYAIDRKLGITGGVDPCRPQTPPPPGTPADPVAEAPQVVCSDAPFGDYWVTRQLPAGARAKAIAELVALLRASPQVAAVWTHDELAAAPIPHGEPQDWTLLDRARASFDAERSGDVVMLLKRAVVPIVDPMPTYTATHGSAWDYDRRVPLLFWRKGINGFEQPAPVETVDIAPTLAALIDLPVPAGAFDGRCLDIDGGAQDSCRGAASVPSAAHEH